LSKRAGLYEHGLSGRRYCTPRSDGQGWRRGSPAGGIAKPRWKKHLQPVIGRYAADHVDVSMLQKLLTAKLAAGMSPATVRLLIRLVSTIYSDLIDDGKATGNPAKMLPKATRRLLKPTYDPKKTPFIQKRRSPSPPW
jgi:hypothetical protein